jgi:iron-sulfur cluster assembly protein
MISLSPTALAEVRRLKGKFLPNSSGALRISVQSKGCAGLSYQLDFDDSARAEDRVFDCGDVQVLVNVQTLPYLDGLALDYSEDLMGGSFRFNNPQAKQTCSCGHSFLAEPVETAAEPSQSYSI